MRLGNTETLFISDFYMKVFLFSPSMRDQSGLPATNLGDLIIRKAVDSVLLELFPAADVVAASTHSPLSGAQMQQASQADIVLVGGTNLLSSHVLEYDQWNLSADANRYSAPPDLQAVMLGVGWWQYQDAPDSLTCGYYRSLFHRSLPHSVRDGYTKAKLAECGITNVVNTSCMTLWGLHGRSTARTGSRGKCVFTLTDYRWDIESDNAVVRLLLEKYEELIFFPQGSHDQEYVTHIPAVSEAGSRIVMLPHEISAFYDITAKGDCDYIGTRLHAGAWCLQSGLPSLILAVDNRSAEIAKDVTLPVVERINLSGIAAWIDGTFPEGFIALPEKTIADWKKTLKNARGVQRGKGVSTGVEKIPVKKIFAQDNTDRVLGWLQKGESEGSRYSVLSPARSFAHDEGDYDAQYLLGDKDLRQGHGLSALLQNRNADTSSPALELGCGTGTLTLGLADKCPYPLLIVSDMSPAFLDITHQKMVNIGVDPSKIKLAVYDTDNVLYAPPREAFSLIAMRATLHHILHPEQFIAAISALLSPGGFFVVHEPCRDGFLILGMIAKMYALTRFSPPFFNSMQNLFLGRHRKKYIEMATLTWQTMVASARQDIDKSEMEDKHIFAPAEVINWGNRCGLQGEFIPNVEFREFSKEFTPSKFSFAGFTKSYMQHCMSFPDDFVDDFCAFAKPYLEYVEESSRGTAPPAYYGVFLFKKV